MARSEMGEWVRFDGEAESLASLFLRPHRLLAPFRLHRRLVLRLALREWAARYRGSFLGALWSLAHPLLILAVYSLVLGGVLRVRWPVEGGASGAVFALLLFSGIVPFGFLGETLSSAAERIAGAAATVRRVVFPLEILPLVGLLANGAQALVGLALLVIGAGVTGRLEPALLPWLLPVGIVLVLFVFWTSTLAAALGVFVRDLRQAIPVMVQVMFFGAPVFYPPSLVPEAWRGLVALNPMTPVVVSLRGILLEGRAPDGTLLVLWALFHAGAGIVALAFFRRSKAAFADVI